MTSVPADLKDLFHTYFSGMPAAVLDSPAQAKEVEDMLRRRGHSFRTKVLRTKHGPMYYVMLLN